MFNSLRSSAKRKEIMELYIIGYAWSMMMQANLCTSFLEEALFIADYIFKRLPSKSLSLLCMSYRLVIIRVGSFKAMRICRLYSYNITPHEKLDPKVRKVSS